jgi:hypothetical protein
VGKGRAEEGRAALTTLRGVGADVGKELHGMTAAGGREAGGKGAGAAGKTFVDMLRDPLARSRMLICVVLQVCQQLAGINAIV